MDNVVREYIAKASPEQQELFLKLQEMIYEVQPELETKISYGIIKYYHGQASIFLGFWKQGVSIYPGYLDDISDFRSKHPEIKTRMGTINLKLGDAVPWLEIREIVVKKLNSKV